MPPDYTHTRLRSFRNQYKQRPVEFINKDRDWFKYLVQSFKKKRNKMLVVKAFEEVLTSDLNNDRW